LIRTYIQGTIEQHYRLFCSCGVLIVSCDCPCRTKHKVVIESGCDYCAKIAALQQAAAQIATDPCFRDILRR